MGNTIEIAASSNLVGSYHAMFDGILNSTAGQLITKVGAAAAVILALGLILGGAKQPAGLHVLSKRHTSHRRSRRHLHLRWPDHNHSGIADSS